MKICSRYFSRQARGAVLVALAAAWSVTLIAAEAAPWQVRRVTARNALKGVVAAAVASDGVLRPGERSFLNRAVEVSRQQMRLAEVGISQAADSEVRSHASQLAADYRRLDDALEALIRRKGGIAEAPVGGTSETYAKLAEKNGATFDREFVRVAARMADEVLTLFEQGASESKDVDVRDLAAEQLPVLRAHRNEIVDLKKALE